MSISRFLFKPALLSASVALCAVTLSGTTPVYGQHDVFTSLERYQFEQISPVNLTEPDRPVNRLGPGPEGWIKLRFSINADGTTANIETLDFMPTNFSRKSTIQTVETWTFEPAVIDGEAVEWHNNILVVNFDLPEIPNISGPRFTEPYSEAQALFNEGRLDRAARRANNNLGNEIFSLHDIGLGNMQIATIQMQLQDMHLALEAITRATLPGISQLTNEELEIALLYRFNIELILGRYVEALDTYNRRTDIMTIPPEDTMHQQAEQIQQALDQGLTLNAKGKILDRDAGWFFIPSRRTFTIADIDGDIDSIKATCNTRIIPLEYQPDVEWSLPENWGDCSLNVMGDRNTTFTFYEFTD